MNGKGGIEEGIHPVGCCESRRPNPTDRLGDLVCRGSQANGGLGGSVPNSRFPMAPLAMGSTKKGATPKRSTFCHCPKKQVGVDESGQINPVTRFQFDDGLFPVIGPTVRLGILAAFLAVNRNGIHSQDLDFEQLFDGLLDLRGRGAAIRGQGILVELIGLDGPLFGDPYRFDDVKRGEIHIIRRPHPAGLRVERVLLW